MVPSEESTGSGYDGARQIVNGICVHPQTTPNEDVTRGSKVRYTLYTHHDIVTCTTIIQTAVEYNAEQSDNVDVTRTCFTLMEDSPTNAISVHNIPSQYTADPDMTADDLTADKDNEDPPSVECDDDPSNNGILYARIAQSLNIVYCIDSMAVYEGCAYPVALHPMSSNNAVSLGNSIQLDNVSYHSFSTKKCFHSVHEK